jgi:phosphonate transport system substrate-binding protein
MRYVVIFWIMALTLGAKELVFGVVPQQSPDVLAQKWQPLIEHLAKQSHTSIVFRTASTIPKFEEALYRGDFDIAYVNPYHFVVAKRVQEYDAIVRSNKMLKGILVAKKGAMLESLEQKRFLFPAPKAFAATLLLKYEFMRKMGVDIEKSNRILYVNSHDSVYKGVARGIGDFGGGIVRTYENLSDNIAKENLHIIYQSDSYPSHPIIVKPSVSKRIKSILLQSPKALLSPLGMQKFIDINNSEYQKVEQLANQLGI